MLSRLYSVRFRRWESLVEFSTIWRSGAQAEALCFTFEQYMDLNESYFLQAGMAKMAPWGRTGEPDVRLDNAGVHYRKTLYYFRTQEFQVAGPRKTITAVDMDIIPNPTTSGEVS